MTLNVTECCRTIGCNCAGTQSIEFWNDLTNIPMLFFTIGGVAVILIITYLIFLKTKYDMEQRHQV